MKTDELVSMLAQGDIAVPSHTASKRIGLALAGGIMLSFGLMLLVLGIRPDLMSAIERPMFWVKLLFALSFGIMGLVAVSRLSRPGVPLKKLPWAFSIPISLIWLWSLVLLVQAPPAQRLSLLLGDTWVVCPALIALLAAPIFAAAIWAVRSLAPTQLPQAGAAVGLMAGGWGAVVYCLHCPEMSAPFIGTWYLLGIMIPAVFGAVLGKTLLRW